HHFVYPTTVKTAGHAADLVVEVTMQRGAGHRQLRAARYAVDIAVEGLHHSEDELCHVPPFTVPIVRNHRAGHAGSGRRSQATPSFPRSPSRGVESSSGVRYSARSAAS